MKICMSVIICFNDNFIDSIAHNVLSGKFVRGKRKIGSKNKISYEALEKFR